MKIDGLHPAEYAAQWGDGQTSDGALFYNCSGSVPGNPRRVRANPEWTAADWAAFSAAIRRNIERVRASIDRGETAWTAQDLSGLRALKAWTDSLIVQTSGDSAEQAASAYIECALWSAPDYTELGMAEQSGVFDASEYLTRVTRAMRDEARGVCARFMAENKADLEEWGPGQIGHDLWLTRNGHGAGFRDRDTGTRESRDRLSEAARKLGQRYVYRNRGWFYFE